jgi:hypothetical protein
VLKLDTATDLETLFNLELDTGTPPPANEICTKCNGSGNFIGYTGRVVGPCFACKGKGVKELKKPVTVNRVDVSKIAEAFAKAFSNGVKRPKLRLGAFVFSRAPDTGRNAGSIYVKKGDMYLGKITNGEFFPVRDCDTATTAEVIEVASKPGDSAKAFGFRTGTCSCCGRTLTNKESIDLGIGPICAERFGF